MNIHTDSFGTFKLTKPVLPQSPIKMLLHFNTQERNVMANHTNSQHTRRILLFQNNTTCLKKGKSIFK